MALIICICDYQSHRNYLQITENNNKTVLKSLKQTGCKSLKRLKLTLDGITAFYFIRELTNFTNLRHSYCSNPAFRGLQLLWIEIVEPAKQIIDYKWNFMVHHTLWERIEADHLMSWLSTLGGGYSALGEQFSRCAETAGKISLKQLTIGLRLGDPFLQSRCKLYFSISLIQTGKLRAAKHIVRDQYNFAIKYKEYDGRLVKMCKGIWLRLQYEYELRLKQRASKPLSIRGAGDA